MIDFIRYKRLFFTLSLILLIPSVFSLLRYGVQPSIDFTGGALYEVRPLGEHVPGDSDEVVRNAVAATERDELREVVLASVQETNQGSVLMRLSAISDAQRVVLRGVLSDPAVLGDLEEVRFETVGPTVGRELVVKTAVAIAIAALSIVLFVAWTFKDVTYGLAAVLAMFHDTLIVVGAFSLFGVLYGVEVDGLFVAAVLTILSFSVHDTIVVFDRIRESLHTLKNPDFTTVANKAVSETLVRSINNSLTIIFMLLALIMLGGDTIRWFVVALLIGTIAGTYSSTFTAVPLLHTFMMRKDR